jgi:hypothetical protein
MTTAAFSTAGGYEDATTGGYQSSRDAVLQNALMARGGRPINRQVSIYGDSRPPNGILINASNNQFYGRGILSWPRILSRQAFDHNTSDVHGVGGYTSDQVLGLLQTGLPTDTAGTIVVLCSTNDRGVAAMTAAQSIYNLLAIQTLVLSYGKVLIWLNEMPRGGSNVLTSPQLQYHLQVNAWFNQQSVVPGVYVADSFGAMVNPTDTSASPLANLEPVDGLHPTSYGAYIGTSGSLLTILNFLFPPRNLLCTSAADLYDAANNPRGVLNANPLMTGVGGSIGANGGGTLSGTIADNYTVSMVNATGVTAVMTGDVSTTSFNGVTYAAKTWTRAAITGTPSSAGALLKIVGNTAIQSNIALGDTLEQTVEYEMDAAQTGILSIENEAVLSSFNRRDMMWQVATELYPTVGIAAVMRVGPWVADAATIGFYKPQLSIQFIQSVAVSATVRFRACAVRKVA